jgi:prepilin-type N-terminal cleavage/methylation domain-containing protein
MTDSRCPRSRGDNRRPAFTLVELLVAMVIMLAVAAMLLALTPRINQAQKAAKGADLLQGWLLIAKQRALRDQVPTGIRMQRASTVTTDPNFTLVREMQYIQQPDDLNLTVFSGGMATAGMITVTKPATGWQATLTGATSANPTVDFFGGFGPQSGDPITANQALWAVQPGDYLEIQGGGLLHLITAVTGMPAGPKPATSIGDTLHLNSPPANANALSIPTAQYRIVRAPRLLTGETPLQLPQDVAIDLAVSLPSTGSFTGNLDLLFAPSGAVLALPTMTSPVTFWVRDTTQDSIVAGDPRLVAVQYGTGFIAVHPVDPTPGSYYIYTMDGRSSGL